MFWTNINDLKEWGEDAIRGAQVIIFLKMKNMSSYSFPQESSCRSRDQFIFEHEILDEVTFSIQNWG